MSYPKTPRTRAPKPSNLPVWRYRVHQVESGWCIDATHSTDDAPSWRFEYRNTPWKLVLKTAIRMAFGRIDPSNYVWVAL